MTASIATSTAVAFDLTTVPDFVAGFIYGLTEENHLSEVEQCF